MIFLMTGTPGSGKSLHMAEIIYYAVKYKRPVIANFEINRDCFQDASSFHYLPNNELTPRAIQDIALEYFKHNKFGEGKVKVFIDEAQVILSSRNWRDADRNDWITFASQHRKLGVDLYIVAQHHEMIDKQIRSLVEYEVSHRKVNNVGWFGKAVTLLTLGTTVCVAVTKWYGQKMRLSSEWFIGRKKFYAIYNTYKIFDDKNIQIVPDGMGGGDASPLPARSRSPQVSGTSVPSTGQLSA